jgi:hypothetical protein
MSPTLYGIVSNRRCGYIACDGTRRVRFQPQQAPFAGEERRVSRDKEPVRGQWYDNLEENETFRVLGIDEDSELVEIEYEDGDIEEIDIDTWHELDLETTVAPEGWSDEPDSDDDDDDDDWDEDEDDDDDDDDDFDEEDDDD